MDKFIIQQKNEKAYKTVSTIEPSECSKLSTSANSPSTNVNKSLKKLKKQVAKNILKIFPEIAFKPLTKEQ